MVPWLQAATWQDADLSRPLRSAKAEDRSPRPSGSQQEDSSMEGPSLSLLLLHSCCCFHAMRLHALENSTRQ